MNALEQILNPDPVPTRTESAFRLGTVTEVSPYRVRLDGDTSSLPITPINATGGDLGAGARVWCQHHGRALILVGAVDRNLPPEPAPEPAFVTYSLTPLNGWTRYSASFNPLSARRTADGIVHLGGLLKGNNASSETAFYLPPECTPDHRHAFYGVGDGVQVRVDVFDTGEIRVRSAGSGYPPYVYLDGHSFPVER